MKSTLILRCEIPFDEEQPELYTKEQIAGKFAGALHNVATCIENNKNVTGGTLYDVNSSKSLGNWKITYGGENVSY